MMQNSNNSSMQKRQELVELFTQLGLPMGLLTQYTAQMRGKTQQQQEEIAQFRKVQADTRRQLKNVRKELTADIDSLGLMLKVLNILAIPALVIFFGIFRGLKRRKH